MRSALNGSLAEIIGQTGNARHDNRQLSPFEIKESIMANKEEEPDEGEVDKHIREGEGICDQADKYLKELEKTAQTLDELAAIVNEE
jgi:hypothetical protein